MKNFKNVMEVIPLSWAPLRKGATPFRTYPLRLREQSSNIEFVP